LPEEVSNFWICSGCINQTVLVKNKAYFTRIPLVCETRILSDSTIFFFWKLFTFYFFVKNYCINNLRLMTMKTNVFQNIKSENWLSYIFLLWTLPSSVLQNQIIRLLGKLDTFFYIADYFAIAINWMSKQWTHLKFSKCIKAVLLEYYHISFNSETETNFYPKNLSVDSSII